MICVLGNQKWSLARGSRQKRLFLLLLPLWVEGEGVADANPLVQSWNTLGRHVDMEFDILDQSMTGNSIQRQAGRL
jgi:hypothetical protein